MRPRRGPPALVLALLALAGPGSALLAAPPGIADDLEPLLGSGGLGASPPADLAAAVRALDARLGVQRDPLAIESLAALDPGLQAPLSKLLGALLAANEARDLAYADVSPAELRDALERPAAHSAALAERVHKPIVEQAALALARAVDEALPALRAYHASLPRQAQLQLAPPLVDLAPALVVDPLGGPTTYTKDAFLALDLGGDDVYDMNAGGSIIAFSPVGDPSTYQVVLGSVAIGGEFEDAALVFGATLAVDIAGDDVYGVYKDPRPGSNDARCNPGPVVRRVVIQGSGSGGIGMLVDAQGNDQYRGKTLAQGDGHIAGVGVLADLLGDDTYTAIRSAQGSAVLGGTGALLDLQGNDRYTLQAPVNGLWNVDSGGCDKTGRLGIGAAVLQSEALLIEGGGDDAYRAQSQALGFGSAQAFGAFVDAGGQDDYGSYARANGQQAMVDGGFFADV